MIQVPCVCFHLCFLVLFLFSVSVLFVRLVLPLFGLLLRPLVLVLPFFRLFPFLLPIPSLVPLLVVLLMLFVSLCFSLFVSVLSVRFGAFLFAFLHFLLVDSSCFCLQVGFRGLCLLLPVPRPPGGARSFYLVLKSFLSLCLRLFCFSFRFGSGDV